MLLRVCGLMLLLLAGCAVTGPRKAAFEPTRLAAAESAFAATMQQRDFAAFAAHIADDAVFINGGKPLRGKPAILEHWQAFFKDAAAPFSWSPEIAEIGGQDPGTL